MSGGSGIVKHSPVIAGHRTSISLERVFWDGLRAIAAARGTAVGPLVTAIDRERGTANLSSAIRVFVYREATGAEGEDTHPRTRP